MFTAKDFLEYQKERVAHPRFKPPDGVIFCYSRNFLDQISRRHKVTKAPGLFRELLLLDETGGRVAVLGNFGIGAPVVVTFLEELIAFGVRRFVSVGTAGTLRKDLGIGDIVICDRAIRDEGTSFHYLKPSKYAYASKPMIESIKKSLEVHRKKYVVGTSWTIDAPYRETVAEARKYQKEGVATVEMEASALFAVAKYRNVEMVALFAISDSLAELEWDPKFHHKRIDSSLGVIFQAALDVLNSYP